MAIFFSPSSSQRAHVFVTTAQRALHEIMGTLKRPQAYASLTFGCSLRMIHSDANRIVGGAFRGRGWYPRIWRGSVVELTLKSFSSGSYIFVYRSAIYHAYTNTKRNNQP